MAYNNRRNEENAPKGTTHTVNGQRVKIVTNLDPLSRERKIGRTQIKQVRFPKSTARRLNFLIEDELESVPEEMISKVDLLKERKSNSLWGKVKRKYVGKKIIKVYLEKKVK